MELGKDSDTGGQVRYVVELANALSQNKKIKKVDLMTRLVPGKDSSYATPIEKINEKAQIVRIPCGPKRYLKKERLWPYLDSFVDKALQHIKKTGIVPDIIHAHYADAGYVGGQLARLLGVNLIFTGHSLGRVKQETLLTKGKNTESLERKFNFKQRIEAEEFALDTANIVITSTHQEIEEQYKLYDHYAPKRMTVIPPGVDLSRYTLQQECEHFEHPYLSEIKKFLRNPEKPMILAVARPDEKKNFSTLLKAFAENSELREKANLVLIAGNRKKLSNLSPPSRKILRNLMFMIDQYDLYGSVAYPRSHEPDDIPALYRLAVKSGGIFVNPAFNEPFGLTLIEAAASGLPIIATNDGGPRDIIASCQNGILIDPNDSQKIGVEILKAIKDRVQWKRWSENGIKGAHSTYSWKTHVDSYIEKIKNIKINDNFPENKKILCSSSKLITITDRILAVNIDEVFTGDTSGVSRFYESLSKTRSERIGICFISRRSKPQVLKTIKHMDIPMPDVFITSAGSEIYYGKSLIADVSWRRHISYKWKPEEIFNSVSKLPFIEAEIEDESMLRIAFIRKNSSAASKRTISQHLRKDRLRANIVISYGIFLDILPIRSSISLALRYLLLKWGISPERLLVAGSSSLQENIFSGNALGVVTKPYDIENKYLVEDPRTYFTKNERSDGLIEGIEYYNFYDTVKVPTY